MVPPLGRPGFTFVSAASCGLVRVGLRHLFARNALFIYCCFVSSGSSLGSVFINMGGEAKRVKAFGTVCLHYPTVRISEN